MSDVLTFVISLERSLARRAEMCRQLDAAGLGFEFFSAVDGRRNPELTAPFYDDRSARVFLGRPLSPGERGCFLSHYRLWELCVARNEPLLVFEDDVSVDPNAATAVEVAGAMLPLVGLVRLAALRERKGRPFASDRGYTLMRFPCRLVGLQCYAIAPAAAATLLRHAHGWVEPVDEFVDRFWVHGQEIFGLVPFVVHHHEEKVAPSEIGTVVRGEKLRGLAKFRREVVRVREGARRESANLRAWFEDILMPGRRFAGSASPLGPATIASPAPRRVDETR